MPQKIKKEDAIVVRFGGGINSRASEDEIHPNECAAGENFTLDPKKTAYISRKPFDLLGTAPNAGSIDGFANLLKADGTVSMLVQAGTNVYEWTGSAFSASKGTVAAGTKLRGPLSQNWQLTDKVIITDIALIQPVMEWDGTTLQNVTFTDETLSTAFGTFKSRYCIVQNERAIFANIDDNSTAFPHLLIGSLRGDYTVITVSQRPSSSLSDADPFFLIQPDYRYINGLVDAFGVTVTSSKKGQLFNLTGTSATDFAFDPFYPLSGVDGDEAIAYIGNDIMYAKQGRIESVVQSQKFGDTENDDLSIKILDDIQDFTNWTLIYNQRFQRVYCIPSSQSQAWVFFKSVYGTDVSPWAKWTSLHATSMQPTAIMSMLDPSDGLEYTFFGDSSGNLYRMEGSGASGDGGTASIRTSRTSASFRAELDSQTYNMMGWIMYRSLDAVSVNITFMYNGQNVFDQSLSLTLPATSGRKVYGGGYYYSDSNYYSESLSGRLTRERLEIPSGSTEFQVRITYQGTAQINIQEVGMRFEAVS